ncbi:hypothetical protein AURDEDRAFT_131791 [Auricularia subglabra TFB-10046 SS5]|uniref:Uncharacterized protein n=1 Tax=Auricularia subglabra (strain TFB-10046 / SS5) TaxID=717982 RepID=J0WN25_AURST|nr:hypothetical protein AURDEDRAFT_131791 [Auricularia subglabra TFB-10046 SS5]
MARDWSQAQKDYVRWGQLRGVQLGIPQHAFLRGRQCLGHLAHPQNQRQLLETVAGYQRYLQEVRGWNNYQQCCSEQRDVERLMEAQGRPLAPSLGVDGERKPYRGVFTWSEDVAKRIAQFGVPVFLIAALRKGQQVVWKSPLSGPPSSLPSNPPSNPPSISHAILGHGKSHGQSHGKSDGKF